MPKRKSESKFEFNLFGIAAVVGLISFFLPWMEGFSSESGFDLIDSGDLLGVNSGILVLMPISFFIVALVKFGLFKMNFALLKLIEVIPIVIMAAYVIQLHDSAPGGLFNAPGMLDSLLESLSIGFYLSIVASLVILIDWKRIETSTINTTPVEHSPEESKEPILIEKPQNNANFEKVGEQIGQNVTKVAKEGSRIFQNIVSWIFSQRKKLIYGAGILILMIVAWQVFQNVDFKEEPNASNNNTKELQSPTHQDNPEEPKQNIRDLPSVTYMSTDMGTREYMERRNNNGYISWFYSSEDKVNNLELGLRISNGNEVVYFYSKPKETYAIIFDGDAIILSSRTGRQVFHRIDGNLCGINQSFEEVGFNMESAKSPCILKNIYFKNGDVLVDVDFVQKDGEYALSGAPKFKNSNPKLRTFMITDESVVEATYLRENSVYSRINLKKSQHLWDDLARDDNYWNIIVENGFVVELKQVYFP